MIPLSLEEQVRVVWPKAICIKQVHPVGGDPTHYLVKPSRSSVTILGQGKSRGLAWSDALENLHKTKPEPQNVPVEPMTDACQQEEDAFFGYVRAVRAVHPKAVFDHQLHDAQSPPFVIREHLKSPIVLGAGDTPGAAWIDAAQRLSEGTDRPEPHLQNSLAKIRRVLAGASPEDRERYLRHALRFQEPTEAAPDDHATHVALAIADMVNHPPHYTASESGIECIDAIRAALTPEEFRGFCKGNSLKYAWREKHKGGDEDLKKAAWYLNKITES